MAQAQLVKCIVYRLLFCRKPLIDLQGADFVVISERIDLKEILLKLAH